MRSPPAPIGTERLLLRPIAAGDVDAFAHLYADPEVVRFIGDGTTATREEAAEWVGRSVARNANEGFDRRAVVMLDSGGVIGWCGIGVWDIEGLIEHEIGYVLARDSWGRGLATEAASAMLDHAVGTLGLRRLVSLIAHGNDASERVARKLGLAYEREAPFHGRTVQLFSIRV